MGNNEGSAFYTVSPLVPYSNYNKDYNAASVDQCFPHSTNGVVMQAEIVMEGNPFDTTAGDLSLASKIYDTDTDLGLEEGQDGRLQFCARIAYYIGDDDAKELISYLDTVSPLVPYSNYNKDYNAASVDQCFPHSTDGVVMQAEIVMEGNPFDTTAGDLSL